MQVENSTIYNTENGNAIGVEHIDDYEFLIVQAEEGLIINLYYDTYLRAVVKYTYIHDRMDYEIFYCEMSKTKLDELLQAFTEQTIERAE